VSAGSEASPRVRLTPNGIVHIGLRNASPTAFHEPQQRHAALLDSTARSHDLTQRLAEGLSQDPQQAARALQAGHTPDRQDSLGGSTGTSQDLPPITGSMPSALSGSGSFGGSAGAAHGLPSGPVDPPPTLDDVQYRLGLLPQAEVELTGMGNSMDMVQINVSSMKSIRTEDPEDKELLSLRPTRDFVEHFNQHTSFHRRKIIRNAMEGDIHALKRLLSNPAGCEHCVLGPP